jgi:hypothetical protein
MKPNIETQAAMRFARFDPWPDCLPVGARRPVLSEHNYPRTWALLPSSVRQVIGGAALSLLAEHPSATARDASRLAFGLWDAVRSLRPDGLRSVESWLTEPGVTPAPTLFLGQVISALLDAGDVLAGLRTRRAALDLEIHTLERIRGEGQ